jgi:hypothetical protein
MAPQKALTFPSPAVPGAANRVPFPQEAETKSGVDEGYGRFFAKVQTSSPGFDCRGGRGFSFCRLRRRVTYQRAPTSDEIHTTCGPLKRTLSSFEKS